MSELQKQKRIRARVEGIYNKQESDFASREEWDDYLEEREDIIYSLVEKEDVDKAEAKIAAYEQKNLENIVQNEARKAEQLQAAAKAKAPQQAAPVKAGCTPAADAALPARGSMQYTASAAMPAAQNVAQPAPKGADTGGLVAAEAQQETGAYERMAAASGWDPAFQHRRMVQMAYSSLFARGPGPQPSGVGESIV
ncbi:g8403 [Coccomyxa viridis]|uniref:G8403 protein n=1 Tax=Coccomyxa viridis TaxID=1274662 RepID=A0ABP1G0A0_9CHLO